MDRDPERNFGILYEQTFQEVSAYCRRRTRSVAEAEDLLSSTYLIAWDRREAFMSAESPVAWLYAVAHNQIRNQWRRNWIRRGSDVPFPDVVPKVEPTVEEQVEARLEFAGALSALDRLKRRDQELIRLAVFENLSYREIGQVLGMGEREVKTSLFRARTRLKAEFSKWQRRRRD